MNTPSWWIKRRAAVVLPAPRQRMTAARTVVSAGYRTTCVDVQVSEFVTALRQPVRPDSSGGEIQRAVTSPVSC